VIILELLYLLNTTLLAIYGLNSLLLTWLHLRQGNNRPTFGASDLPSAGSHPSADYPAVTVQLPVYNERHVTERLLNAVVKLDWPAEKMQIQVLDDSTDDTSQIIAAALARHRAQGAQMRLDQVQRSDRRGFKAGALQHGLASAEGEFIAIFDADFVPN
jgi:cellulose synthase/poly-beta-1,6-N-acetylglucosamine synthase-like glycosyltransferase